MNIYNSFISGATIEIQLSLLPRRHEVKANLRYTDEAQGKAETRVYTQLPPCKNTSTTPLAASFAAKGLLILMTSSFVAIII